MTTGTGLDGQIGYKLESSVGTAVTVDKFIEFESEALAFEPSYIEPSGLRVGQKYKRGARLAQSRKHVAGSLDTPFYTRNMGALLKAMLGSSVTTPTLVLGSAYKQVHQTGDLLGKSLTIQAGRPEPSGTVRAHTYFGCKVAGWEINVSENDKVKLKLDIDGWNETTATALATASFLSVEEFHFGQCTAFTLGATISGTTELTASGGTAVAAVVKSLSFKGDNALDTERYGLGNSGVKKEQLENGVPVITGTLEAEYSQSEFYTPFTANTATSLLLRFEGSVISGSDKNTLEFIAPEIRIKKVTPQVTGPDTVKANVEFEVYQNTTGLNPFQIKVISADSAAI